MTQTKSSVQKVSYPKSEVNFIRVPNKENTLENALKRSTEELKEVMDKIEELDNECFLLREEVSELRKMCSNQDIMLKEHLAEHFRKDSSVKDNLH